MLYKEFYFALNNYINGWLLQNLALHNDLVWHKDMLAHLQAQSTQELLIVRKVFLQKI
jgi:hypothetical protein